MANPSYSWTALLPSLAVRMSCGLAAGIVVGLGAAFVFNRLRLEYEGLYPVLSMSIVLLAYGLSETVHGNGFLAVYACGIVLGNRDFKNKRYLAKFHDGLGWLMQIVLFLALGLLVFPSRLPHIAGKAVMAATFLMFVARPVAVYLGLWRSGFTMPERSLVAWTGLRGAVPIVLATFPFTAGYERSDTMFNIVFFIVLASVLLQGKTLMVVARWLKVDAPLLARPRSPIEFERGEGIQSETREVEIPPDASAVGKHVSALRLPPNVLILLVRRGQGFLVPKGATELEAFDTLMLIGPPEELTDAQTRLLTARATTESQSDPLAAPAGVINTPTVSRPD